MTRLGVYLSALLLVCTSCGHGAEGETAVAGDALRVRLLPDGSVRWVAPDRPEGHVEAIPTPGARLSREGETVLLDVAKSMPKDATWRLQVEPESTWGPVRKILRAVRVHGGVTFEGTGHEHLVHRALGPAQRDELHVLVVLGESELEIQVRGTPWVRSHGCGTTGGEWRETWPRGAVALDGLATVIGEGLDLVQGDASRVRVRIRAGDGARAFEVLDVWHGLRDAGASHVHFEVDEDRRRTRGSVDAALKWLLAHQSPDGRWASASFDLWCDGAAMPCADLGVGEAGHDIHAGSLALLAFLGAGYTSRGRHPFAACVRKGSRWLEGLQGEDGFVGERTGAKADEGHALATFFLAEHFGMVGEKQASAEVVQRALGRLPGVLARAEDDLRTVGWVLAAFVTARGVVRDREARSRSPALALPEGLEAELQRAVEEAPVRHGPRGDALALLGRILLGEDPRRSEAAKALASRVVKRLPRADALDPWMVFFATNGLFQVGGASWKTWNEHLKKQVTDSQIGEGSACCRRGSWDASGPDAALGGRLAATALLAMSLQVYYAYHGLLQGR